MIEIAGDSNPRLMIGHDRTRLTGSALFLIEVMKKTIYIAFAAILLAGCSGRYIGQPREAMLLYQTEPTYGSLYSLASAYADNINAAVAADTLHPGMYADYGVALALMGHNEEACRMMNVEVKAFPQSIGMMRRISARILPDCDIAGGGLYMHDTADRTRLAAWAYDSISALRSLPPIASVIDSTDSVRVAMQTPVDSVDRPVRLTANQKRILLEQQQNREARMAEAAKDSVAAAKQAKIKARNQAQADKKKAKKDKERAKKAAEKAKKQAAKEKKKQQQLAREAAKQSKKGGSK